VLDLTGRPEAVITLVSNRPDAVRIGSAGRIALARLREEPGL
jgi:hypothetical protein